MNKRPVFLNLFQIRFPITALVSIAHRVSGIVLILVLPLFIWMLSHLDGSPEDFLKLQHCLQACFLFRFVVWVGISAFVYHVLAGLRHILLDMGFAHSLGCARKSAWLLALLALALMVLSGVRLW